MSLAAYTMPDGLTSLRLYHVRQTYVICQTTEYGVSPILVTESRTEAYEIFNSATEDLYAESFI